jgi:hypothetical protein
MAQQHALSKVKLPFGQVLNMLSAYIRSKVVEQIKTVALIVAYLVLFQLVILGIPVTNALVVALGIGGVVLGLAFFMEGLFLGLMPLGETCGIKLPQKTVLPVILIFAFVLGLGATFAEPAIGVLKSAGSSVKAWDAPLLFLLLNKHSAYLVWFVGIGVGVAVMFGMLRFLYHWSLKPFIYILYSIIGSVSIWAYFDPNLVHLTGLAWDCGGVTTGPVTVPLVLALGIGISRVASQGGEGGAAGGFGVVTLASAFPIAAVMGLGLYFLPNLPQPAGEVEFCSPANRDKALYLFADEQEMKGYVLKHGSLEARRAFFSGDSGVLDDYVVELAGDEGAQTAFFGSHVAFERWLLTSGSYEQRLRVYGSEKRVWEEAEALYSLRTGQIDTVELLARNGLGSLQAIVPLSAFLILVLLVVLREKIQRADEIILGIVFAVIGMSLFSIGIELGLSRLGGEIGTNLPTSFKAVEMAQEHEVIRNFDPSIVSKAITAEGQTEEIFSRKTSEGYELLPYRHENFDSRTGQYSHTPIRGPLFDGKFGFIVVVLFGFMMGYSATLAEPALNALGTTVEELTVGTFKKKLLMQAVAIGVGVGIAAGVAKIILGWPLIWMLVPPYAVLMVLTAISSEDFVNIGWDSAGVTTGPVTVPLVLAMGLGISGQVGSIEGFGILSLASVCPILSVLLVGLYVTGRRRAELEGSV